MQKGPLRRGAKKDGDVKLPPREPEKGRTKVRPLQKRRTRTPVWRSRFVSCFSRGEGEGFFDDLGDAAVAGFGRAVIEDGEQVAAAVRRGHTLPSGEGARLAGERQLQNGREFTFSFHGGKQLFGDLFGATNARCGAFYLRNQVGDPFAG